MPIPNPTLPLLFALIFCTTFFDLFTVQAWAAQKKVLPAMSMKVAVHRALKANPALGASRAQARASEEGRKSALGAFGPKLGLSYSALKEVRKSEPVPVHTPELGNYAFGIEVSQIVFDGFRLLADYQKAALTSHNDRMALKKARLDLILEVEQSFISYLLSLANVESQREAMERLADQVTITRALYGAGLAPRLDVLQAEVDLKEAERLLLQVENNLATHHSRLNTLLGLPAHAKTSFSGTLGYVPFSLSLEQCLERAYKLRPDVIMARLAVDIAGKDRKSVQSGYYPKIEAYYNVTNAGNTPGLRQAGENGSRYTRWEVGARATWDVFQWGTTYFADQKAAELVNKMRHEEKDLHLEVGYELKTRFLALREAEKRIRVAKEGVDSANEAYRAALARYREQVGTGFDVLNTSSKLTSAKYSLHNAYADYLTALAALYAAMGEEHDNVLPS